jgi:ribosome-associated heat shock protein Hsp15
MRLDRFLWFARLARSRRTAQEMATTGRLRCDGRIIDRAHAAVRVGCVLTFAQGPQVRTLRIDALPERRGPPGEARGSYTDLAIDASRAQN